MNLFSRKNQCYNLIIKRQEQGCKPRLSREKIDEQKVDLIIEVVNYSKLNKIFKEFWVIFLGGDNENNSSDNFY